MSQLVDLLRRRPWRLAAVVVALLVVGVGVANRDLLRIAVTPTETIDQKLPVARPVDAREGEVVYRIDAADSLVTVTVEEELAGVGHEVELTTSGIAGEIAVGGIADGNPSVNIGEVVVDVAQLRSDNSLRDKVLRHEYLESHRHPQVRLGGASVSLGETVDGPGDRIEVDGASLSATLDVKGVGHPVTFDVDAVLDGDELSGVATATVSLAELGVGPIVKAGLVRTSNEARIELEVVARDARSFDQPTGLVADREVRATDDEGSAPSFSADVQPILESNCAGCHAPGEVGSPMWELADAGDAAEVADGLAVVTGARYMPPWPASDVGVELRHVRRLSDDDISTIASWARAGAPLDVAADSPVDPAPVAEELAVRADSVLTIGEGYQVTPSNVDDYRCFILDPELTEPMVMRGYDFEPDQLEVVHHSIVTRARSYQLPYLREKDAADDGPGWSCLAGMGISTGDNVAGWVPGQRPVRFASGEGFDLEPGDVLVAQIHYHYAPDVGPDRSAMTLELDPLTSRSSLLTVRTLIGPVELPCPTGASGPLCDREAALRDVAERFGPFAPSIANGLHQRCNSTPDAVAATFDGSSGTTTCDFTVYESGELIGMLGHMHEIGSAFRLSLNRPGASEKVLLDIPVWNFGWQLGYSPAEPLRLEMGDVLRVTCRFDRNLRHESEPAWIVFAEGTNDEMCYSSLTLRPDVDMSSSDGLIID